MITVDARAALYVQRLGRDAQTEIDNAPSLFVSRAPFSVAGLLTVDPAKHTNKIALLSNGTFWLAKSDGSDWLYPDNTAV